MTPADYADKVDTILFDDFIISEIGQDADLVLKNCFFWDLVVMNGA